MWGGKDENEDVVSIESGGIVTIGEDDELETDIDVEAGWETKERQAVADAVDIETVDIERSQILINLTVTCIFVVKPTTTENKVALTHILNIFFKIITLKIQTNLTIAIADNTQAQAITLDDKVKIKAFINGQSLVREWVWGDEEERRLLVSE